MTNAPIILTQDCDMYSNDPQTPLRVLCYVCDPAIEPNLRTGTFFRCRALFGDPSTSVETEILELSPDHIVNKPIKSPDILGCSFENQTNWGSKMLLAGCIVVNCFQIYEAISLRSDKGKMPTKITINATFLAGALYIATSIILK
ncbi:hypothetical protein REPUB_Repub08aG0162700 [Reevesia pubescens]